MNPIFRQARLDDLDAVLSVTADAFADEPPVVDLVRDLAIAGAFSSGIALLAEEAGEAVGFVLLTPATVEGATVRLLSLAPLGVASSRQREGIGSGLVQRSLELARERGVEAVVVLGHPGYYPRFGFTPALGWGLTPTNPVPDEHSDAWMVRELVSGALDGVSGRVLMMPPLDDPLYW